jgi:multidrug efflux pump subunit AcrA (membrane-fusion protein)
MAITVGGVIYGFVAKIETSVAARGQLRPIGGVSSVTAPFTGIVEKVLIKEGDLVKRQQPLVQIRDKAASQQLTNLLKIQRLWQQETQVIATRLGFEPSPKEPASIDQLIANQRELTIREQAASVALARSKSDYKSRVAEVVGLERQVKINEKIVIQMIPLVKEGAASELDLERQRERLEAVRTNLLKARGELTSSMLRINETRLQGSHIPAAEHQ